MIPNFENYQIDLKSIPLASGHPALGDHVVTETGHHLLSGVIARSSAEMSQPEAYTYYLARLVFVASSEHYLIVVVRTSLMISRTSLVLL